MHVSDTVLGRAIVAVVTLPLLAAGASAQLFMLDGWTLPPANLYRVSETDASVTTVGRLLVENNFVGMTNDGDRLILVTSLSVYEIDTDTAAVGKLFDLGPASGLLEGAVAFDPADRTLYLANRTTFARASLDTGVVEVVSTAFTGLDLSGMAIDGQGRLLAIFYNGSNSVLFELDRATGARTFVSTLSLPLSLPSVGGMAFNPSNGALYATSATSVFRIDDLSNGPVLVGNTGRTRLAAMAYIPEASCGADFNGDDAVDVFDILAFLTAWSTNEPAADRDDDSAFTIFDILSFLGEWNAGCA